MHNIGDCIVNVYITIFEIKKDKMAAAQFFVFIRLVFLLLEKLIVTFSNGNRELKKVCILYV